MKVSGIPLGKGFAFASRGLIGAIIVLKSILNN